MYHFKIPWCVLIFLPMFIWYMQIYASGWDFFQLFFVLQKWDLHTLFCTLFFFSYVRISHRNLSRSTDEALHSCKWRHVGLVWGYTRRNGYYSLSRSRESGSKDREGSRDSERNSKTDAFRVWAGIDPTCHEPSDPGDPTASLWESGPVCV